MVPVEYRTSRFREVQVRTAGHLVSRRTTVIVGGILLIPPISSIIFFSYFAPWTFWGQTASVVASVVGLAGLVLIILASGTTPGRPVRIRDRRTTDK